jgi:hypothetical protein
MAITLKEVADLIKTGDAVQIQNQEDQGKTLDSIDKGIKKFLAVQERDRLDKLEDRREQRKVRTIAGGGVAVAGGATAGGGSGGPSTMSRILTQGVGTALALGALKAIQLGFRGIKNALATSFGTQRGALLDINKSLTSELKDFQKVLKDDIKVLKAQQKALNSELKKAFSTEADLRRQIQAETRTFTEAGQQRMKALQARLDDAIARRQVLQTDLDSARADLSSARLDLKETRVALSEARAAGKLDAQALRNQVAALERRVAGLRVGQIDTEQAFADRASRLAGPNAQLGTLKVGDNIQYKTTTGKLLDAQVMDTAGGKVQLRTGTNVFSVDAQNLADRTKLPGYGEARIPMTIQDALRQQSLNPFARGTRFNNLLRVPGIFSPEGIVEAGAATGSRITGALGMSRTAGTLASASRLLASGPALFASLVTIPSSIGAESGNTATLAYNIVEAYRDNDLTKFKQSRNALKDYLKKSFPQMAPTISAFINSYLFGDMLLQLGLKDNLEAAQGLVELLTISEVDVARIMKQNLGGEEAFKKFKNFNAALAAAKQNPEVIAAAEIQAKTQTPSYILPGSNAAQGIYSSALSQQARAFVASELGLKPNEALRNGSKFAAIESAIATSAYGPRTDKVPTITGQIGDNVVSNNAFNNLPQSAVDPFDTNSMLYGTAAP